MLFNSIYFLTFFPIVVLIYFIIPKKIREVWLLVTSSFFYLFQSPGHFLFLSLSICTTYLTGRFLGILFGKKELSKKRQTRYGRVILSFCLLINLGMLFCFKYFHFFFEMAGRVAGKFHWKITEPTFQFLLPIGISFYTFQAIGYVIDVYRQKDLPEKNIIRYALFVSFFPLILSGPIERGNHLLPQFQNLKQLKLWDYERITGGVSMMLWGYFMKMVIADRIAIFVNGVYGTYRDQSGILLIAAAVLFSVQIYCDFAGYSQIAIGAAKVMGIDVMENFQAPYFSKNVREFWHRWHISLSTWFRDYLYIPMGGSRCHPVRKYFNIVLTFLVSGIWHGASLHFLVWGGIHGALQVSEDCLSKPVNKINKKFAVNTECFSYRFMQQATTFALVTAAWVFFRARSVREALEYLAFCVSHFRMEALFNGSFYAVGLSQSEIAVMIFSILVLFASDRIRYHYGEGWSQYLNRQNLIFRWLFYVVIFFAILVFGIYGPDYGASQFIYMQF